MVLNIHVRVGMENKGCALFFIKSPIPAAFNDDKGGKKCRYNPSITRH